MFAPRVSRTNLALQPRCVECGTPDTDLDEFGQCFECADVLVPFDVDDAPVCRECGNDIGPYAGLCLDCLEELEGS